MHIVIALAGAAAAVYFFLIRARNSANAAEDLFDMANDVRLAARRFGFTRRTNVHPVDAVEDPMLALAGLGSAFVALDDLPTREQSDALTSAIQTAARGSATEAQEMVVFGRWLCDQCGTPEQALDRLAKRHFKMQGQAGFTEVMEIIQSVAKAGTGHLSHKQKSALEDIQRAFRIS
ncbi:MAG: hypothetical protein N4A61_04390 [Pelagimonas sp.]|jgi:hypothetical protein|nr:hypothetical protein [Pelagimonas sp.]